MKKSILRLVVFSVIPFLVIGYAIYLTGKKTKDFYKRFTSPTQNSLILGSSRAAGLDPEILDSCIHQKFPKVKLYNYAFTWAHSPFGPKYLESIKKKVRKDSKDGFFIVTVEPTALMVERSQPDDAKFYIENDKCVAKTSMVSCNPNIEYLVESYDFSITQALNQKILSPKNKLAAIEILENGKVDIKMLKSIAPEKKYAENKVKMKEFQERINGLKISANRIYYLNETISFLKQHGKVIVVRMPLNKTPYEIENSAWFDFDSRIQNLCTKQKVTYINYNTVPNDYECGDEVHLIPSSIRKFSKRLGTDINLYY